MPPITLDSVSFSHSAEPLLVDITATITDGERVCLVGPNGSGKSTLLDLAGIQAREDHHATDHPGLRLLQPQR